jgi:hypothetical protein
MSLSTSLDVVGRAFPRVGEGAPAVIPNGIAVDRIEPLVYQ